MNIGWHTATPLSAVALAVGYPAAVGYHPARKAAGLDPTHALRYE